VLDEQLHDATDADLFVVCEASEPSGELVSAFDLPRHTGIMPYIA
jgi:hypothetical protein